MKKGESKAREEIIISCCRNKEERPVESWHSQNNFRIPSHFKAIQSTIINLLQHSCTPERLNAKRAYRRIPKETPPVTFGFCRQEGPLLSDSRYFRLAFTFGKLLFSDR